MTLRFKCNQAECFRKGIDCRKSIVHIEVNPEDISQDERNLIADRMSGIDVCELEDSSPKMDKTDHGDWVPVHLEANGPTYEDLLAACRADEALWNQD